MTRRDFVLHSGLIGPEADTEGSLKKEKKGSVEKLPTKPEREIVGFSPGSEMSLKLQAEADERLKKFRGKSVGGSGNVGEMGEYHHHLEESPGVEPIRSEGGWRKSGGKWVKK